MRMVAGRERGAFFGTEIKQENLDLLDHVLVEQTAKSAPGPVSLPPNDENYG
ncbi:MAG: hypothetical protein ACJ8M1_15565 [Chthoniobacterales bacterium]